jgi:hypothetical protein
METPMVYGHELAELWQLTQDGQAVRCLVARHPLGVELRYLVNEQPLISRVFEDWDALAGQARIWRDSLVSRGWAPDTMASTG